MQLSSYVYQTIHQGQEVYYHLVLRKWLPVTTASEILHTELFLEGSEEQAVAQRLRLPIDSCQFTVIPTWECNLRCSHCTVLHKLVDRDDYRSDPMAVVGFVKNYVAQTGAKRFALDFVGGEPLLAVKFINQVIDGLGAPTNTGMTTNLSAILGEPELDCLRRIKSIAISIDGLPEFHNQQRHAYQAQFNPFERTWDNLKAIIRAGLLERIVIKAAVRDAFITPEHERAFYLLLMSIGIPLQKIQFKGLHPTAWKPTPEPSFVRFLKKPQIISDCCCKYRQSNIILSNGKVYSDFHTWTELGNLTDSVDLILDNHWKTTFAMPALQDPRCKSCPVLGACWGGCTNGSALVRENPSKYCDQPGLIAEVQQRAAAGTLVLV